MVTAIVSTVSPPQTKSEAIRRAFRALGVTAPVNEIEAYCKKQFNKDVAHADIYSQRRKSVPEKLNVEPSVPEKLNVAKDTPSVPAVGVNVPKPKERDETIVLPLTPGVDEPVLTSLYLDEIFAVKELAKKVGGMEKLKKLIATYERLVS